MIWSREKVSKNETSRVGSDLDARELEVGGVVEAGLVPLGVKTCFKSCSELPLKSGGKGKLNRIDCCWG